MEDVCHLNLLKLNTVTNLRGKLTEGDINEGLRSFVAISTQIK